MGYYDRGDHCNCEDKTPDWCPQTGGGHESDAVMAERLEMTRWYLSELRPED